MATTEQAVVDSIDLDDPVVVPPATGKQASKPGAGFSLSLAEYKI